MAKIALNKLNQIKKLPPVVHQFGEYEIEVEQYLPLEEKVKLIATVIEQAGNGEEGFFNIVKLDAYYRIEMIKAYTNISFTEKQLEDTTKLFDIIVLNNIWSIIELQVPETERNYIWDNILNLAKEITNYNNSILGILKTISEENSELQASMQNVLHQYEDPELLKLAETLGLKK